MTENTVVCFSLDVVEILFLSVGVVLVGCQESLGHKLELTFITSKHQVCFSDFPIKKLSLGLVSFLAVAQLGLFIFEVFVAKLTLDVGRFMFCHVEVDIVWCDGDMTDPARHHPRHLVLLLSVLAKKILCEEF